MEEDGAAVDPMIPLLEAKIKDLLEAGRRIRKSGDEAAILKIVEEISEAKEKFKTINGGKSYKPSIHDQAVNFCEDYYVDVESIQRSKDILRKYYDNFSTLNIVGLTKLKGRENILYALMSKYDGISVAHEIVKVVAEKVPSKDFYMMVTCTIRVKLGKDAPRKVMEIFYLDESADGDAYPLVITSQMFIVQDARPLYHWPEIPIPVTRHDNWEPQFKPAVVYEAKPAVETAEGKRDDGSVAADGKDGESLEEDESLEGGESLEEASQQEGAEVAGILADTGELVASPKASVAGDGAKDVGEDNRSVASLQEKRSQASEGKGGGGGGGGGGGSVGEEEGSVAEGGHDDAAAGLEEDSVL